MWGNTWQKCIRDKNPPVVDQALRCRCVACCTKTYQCHEEKRWKPGGKRWSGIPIHNREFTHSSFTVCAGLDCSSAAGTRKLGFWSETRLRTFGDSQPLAPSLYEELASPPSSS